MSHTLTTFLPWRPCVVGVRPTSRVGAGPVVRACSPRTYRQRHNKEADMPWVHLQQVAQQAVQYVPCECHQWWMWLAGIGIGYGLGVLTMCSTERIQ